MKKIILLMAFVFGVFNLVTPLDSISFKGSQIRYKSYSPHYSYRYSDRYYRKIMKRIRKNEYKIMKYHRKIDRLKYKYSYRRVSIYKHRRIQSKIYKYKRNLKVI